MTFRLMSPQFEHLGRIPAEYTLDGSNVSPPLMWRDAPSDTQSFALILDDPDAPIPAAPRRVAAHWVLYNFPADLGLLEQDAARDRLPGGAEVGVNDWNHQAYDGPVPLAGRHRYFFKLYALDTRLDSKPLRKRELVRAIRGHVLDMTALMGTYERIG